MSCDISPMCHRQAFWTWIRGVCMGVWLLLEQDKTLPFDLSGLCRFFTCLSQRKRPSNRLVYLDRGKTSMVRESHKIEEDMSL